MTCPRESLYLKKNYARTAYLHKRIPINEGSGLNAYDVKTYSFHKETEKVLATWCHLVSVR